MREPDCGTTLTLRDICVPVRASGHTWKTGNTKQQPNKVETYVKQGYMEDAFCKVVRNIQCLLCEAVETRNRMEIEGRALCP